MKIAIITGGGSGLGHVFYQVISKRYPDLDEYWLIDIQKDKLEKIAEEDEKVRPLTLDLGDDASYQKLQERLEENGADIRVLINNAGVETVAFFKDASEKALINTVKVDAEAVMRIDKSCIPFMNRGSILIHTASIYAFSPVPGDAVYAAAKSFVRSLSMALHEELKDQGIKVLTLCPGSMKTSLDRSDIRRNTVSMPYLKMEDVAKGALEQAEKGRSVYVPHFYYRAYSFFCKILPSTLTARILGKNYR